MTENEIKEYIEELRHKANTLIKSGYATSGISTHFNKSADLIEELLEYKLNGSFSGVEFAQLAAMQMRLRDYQEIGTIEEFKALKEKNEPKRLLTREEKYPQNYGIYSTSDRWCPCCRGLVFTGDWSVYKQNIMYKRIRCGCGQKLDWSE